MRKRVRWVEAESREEDTLDDELWALIEKTARRFTKNIERLSQRHRRLYLMIPDQSVFKFRKEVERSLSNMASVKKTCKGKTRGGKSAQRKTNTTKKKNKQDLMPDPSKVYPEEGSYLNFGGVRLTDPNIYGPASNGVPYRPPILFPPRVRGR